MPDYAVNTRFTANDRAVTSAYDRMGRAADKFGQKSSSAFRNATKTGYQFGTVVKGILAANIIHGGIGYIATGIQGLGKAFIDFDDTMIGATARFNDIGTEVTNFGDRVKQLKTDTREAIAGTKFTAVEAATVMNELAKADFSSAAATGALRSQMLLASATNTEFAESVTISNRLLGAFGLRSDNAAVQIANHVKLNDQLGAAANIANGDLTTLFETLKTAAPVGGLIGTTTEEMIAMGLAIDKAGIDSSMAATSLKRAILNIGSTDVQKQLKANGIEITDNMGKFRRLTDILKDIGTKFKDLNLARTPEITQIMDSMFGKYGLAGVIGLTNNIDTVDVYIDRLRKAEGANKRMDDKLKTGLGYRLQVLGNLAMDFGFKVLNAFEHDGKTGIEALTEAVRKFDPTGLIQGLRDTVTVLKVMWSVVQPFVPYLPLIIQGFIAWKAAAAALFLGNILSNGITWMKGLNGVLAIGNLQITGFTLSLGSMTAAALAAFSVVSALYSLFTGKDNLISQAAQWTGLVPRLATDANGVVTGRLPDAQQSAFIRSMSGIGSALGGMKFPSTADISNQTAPNAKEAQARQAQWNGHLQISGAPAGSSLTQKSTGLPLSFASLGMAQ